MRLVAVRIVSSWISMCRLQRLRMQHFLWWYSFMVEDSTRGLGMTISLILISSSIKMWFWWVTVFSLSKHKSCILLIFKVTINYRLGPFGFLTLGTDEYSGNMGLKDQNMAMKWIKLNAEAFNGDAERITIFGHSAGELSVQCWKKVFQMLNKIIISQVLVRCTIIRSLRFPKDYLKERLRWVEPPWISGRIA